MRYFQTTTKKTIVVNPKFTFVEGMSIEASKDARILEQRRIIGERIKSIKNLAYDTLAGQYVPRGRARCIDLYHQGLPKLRALGQKGGPEYDRATALLKYTWISPENFKETVTLLTLQK